MNKFYWFKLVHDDGSVYEFRKAFPSAFIADRWAIEKTHKWFKEKINYRIILEFGKELEK